MDFLIVMLLLRIVLVRKSLGYTPYDKGVYNSNHGNSAIITNACSSSYLGWPSSADLYDWNLQVIILH